MLERSAKRLLVGIDFSSVSELALDEALERAARRVEVFAHVLHVATARGRDVELELADGIQTTTESEALGSVQRFIEARAGTLGTTRVKAHVRLGAAATEIVRLAAEVDADLIVVGTHGRTGIRRVLIGSVAEAVVRTAGCPVLVVRPKSHSQLRPGG